MIALFKWILFAGWIVNAGKMIFLSESIQMKCFRLAGFVLYPIGGFLGFF